MKPLLTILACLTCLGAMAQTSQFQVVKNIPNNSFDYWEIQGQPEWKEICSVKMDENKHGTNICVSTNYTGTIQVGTNFYTVKDLMVRPNNFDTNGYWIQKIPSFGVSAGEPIKVAK